MERMKMKRILMIGAAVLCLLMASCGTQDIPGPQACTTHDYGEWQTVIASNCTDSGTEQRICAVCEEKQTRTIEKTGHSMGFWTTATVAECLVDGVEARSCENCDYRETRAIEAHGHHFTEWETDGSSCMQNAERSRTCIYCGVRETEYFPAAGHLFGQWYIAVLPTCTENGVNARICSRCGEEEHQALATIGHDLEGIRCDKCGIYLEASAEHDLKMLNDEFGIRLDSSYITRENDMDVYHIVYTVSGLALDLTTHASAPQGYFVLYTDEHDESWYLDRMFFCMTGRQLTETIEIYVPTGTKVTSLEFKFGVFVDPAVGPLEGDVYWRIAS